MAIRKEINDQILIALRRIVRAIDLHSRHLAQEFRLTGPQLILLRELVRNGELHVAELAQNISLSHATVTDILNRLEKRGLVNRTRSLADRRRVLVTPTEPALTLVKKSPPLLQEQFSEHLAQLQEWELAQILSVLQRVALMMETDQVDASPVLTTGAVTADPEIVEIVTRLQGEQPAKGEDNGLAVTPLAENRGVRITNIPADAGTRSSRDGDFPIGNPN